MREIGPELKNNYKVIEDCRYDSKNNEATLYKWGKIISIENDEINILNIKDEADARDIAGMIRNLLEE
ncbi:MAG: hypothetical protein JW882_07920 [Deltaproteobacteria bacterium]|nr:hypothetical protein [Deltaproteobacteria bacterium]